MFVRAAIVLVVLDSTMKKFKKRVWILRLWRLPQLAEERITRTFSLIPPTVRLYVACAFLVVLTTFSISQYPLSLMPEYRPGDRVIEDVVVPIDLELVRSSSTPGGAGETATPSGAGHRQRVVLHAGETVTEETVPVLDVVRRHQMAERSPRRIISLLLLVSLVFFALYRGSMAEIAGRLEPRKAFWVAVTAVTIQAALVRVGMFIAAVLSTRPETMWLGDHFIFQFAIPFAAAALVVSILVGSRLALVVALMTSFLAGLVSPLGMITAGYAVAGSIAAVYSVRRYRTRNAITRASVAIAAVNVVMGLSALLFTDYEMSWRTALKVAVAGALGGLLTSATASFGTPIYESAFGILTDIKLLELSNAEAPLLRKLAIETPGTNHHSFVVAMLAEAAAKAIGANALLARVGCLYHDIGKLAAPTMYIENQQGAANPHDRVSPRDSVRIITGHVRRGLQLAEDANLPQQIMDFIPQHHGTRVLAYFFHKAKSQADASGEPVNIEDFRYPGPKPQTKEAVILMLADGSEAAVRSLEDPTPENIRAIVSKIVDSVVADGQLDECDITFREIKLIRESLINTLIGMYHQRISYPGFNPPGESDGGGGDLNAQIASASERGKSEQQSDPAQARAHGRR